MVERAPPDSSPSTERLAREAGLDPAMLLHQLLDTVSAFTLDSNGKITAWNRGMEELTGFSALEMLGRPCTATGNDLCGAGSGATGGIRCPLFREGKLRSRRCTIRRRDGTRVPIELDARLIRMDGGRVLGAVERLVDVAPLLRLEEEVASLRDEAAARLRFRGLVGRHPSMLRLEDVVELAARSHLPVLIQGETGTGKSLVARAVHEGSDRRDGPFVRVACTGTSERLLENELFGHVRGAFPGALADRQGRVELADGGTLFLDEVADLPPALQTRLLHVLESGAIERQGDPRPVPVNLRIVAATHADLPALAEKGRFRRDLYYRLAALPVLVPPLRERTSDIPLLVEHFLSRLNRSLGRNLVGVSPAAMTRLVEHRWPGNVRELEHALEYAAVLTRDERIEESALPPALGDSPEPFAAPPRPRKPAPDADKILAALARSGGNRTEAARLLGVSRVTLWKWMKKNQT